MRAQVAFAVVLVAVLASVGQAAVTTTVDLVSQDGELPRIALPSVEVRVDGAEAERARRVATALAEDLALRAMTRLARRGEAATYALAVDLPAAESASQRFGAKLINMNGDVVWNVEGVTRSDAGPVAEADLRSLAANVLSALLRDGWVQPRYDPNDPPPPPPAVGRNSP